MDYNENLRRPFRRDSFRSVKGTVVEMVPMRTGGRRADGCTALLTVEDMDGNTVQFILTPSAYVVDHMPLGMGMACTFWYRTDAPVPLIYPPRYRAVVAARDRNGRFIDVSFYNAALVNEDRTLQLNLDGSVELRTVNNQYFQGNPGNRNLVVTYETSTRSMPAQTTPRKVVVLCEQEQM